MQLPPFSVFIVNFEQILRVVLVFPLMFLNNQIPLVLRVFALFAIILSH